MNGGPSSYFKPPEPDENRYGFRKVRRGEGVARVWGAGGNRTSDFKMKVLGRIFVVIALGVPLSMSAGLVFQVEWLFGVFFGCLVMTHLFLIVTEMITQRELPTRRVGMLLCWGWILLVSLVGFLIQMF